MEPDCEEGELGTCAVQVLVQVRAREWGGDCWARGPGAVMAARWAGTCKRAPHSCVTCATHGQCTFVYAALDQMFALIVQAITFGIL